jgi:hypothetical protein
VHDVKITLVDGNKYLIITAIEKAALTEYRLLYRGASFYTATSLLFPEKSAGMTEPVVLPGETIGVNAQGEPYSYPADNPGDEGGEDNGRIVQLLKKAGGKNQVFKKSRAAVYYMLPTALLLGTVATAALYYPGQRPPPPPPAMESREEKAPIPSPLSIVADISGIVLQAGGIILQWHYDENADPVGRMAVEGAEAGALLESIRGLSYITPVTISDIRYAERKAHYEITFTFNGEEYSAPHQYAPGGTGIPRSVPAKIRAEILGNGGMIELETLPMEANGHSAGIVFSCAGRSFEKTAGGIGGILRESGARITYMDMYAESNIFHVSLTVTQSYGMPEYYMAHDKLSAIIPAFGSVIAPEKEIAITTAEEQPGGKEREMPAGPEEPGEGTRKNGYVKIGAIRDSGGQLHVYYKTKEGKIIAETEQP